MTNKEALEEIELRISRAEHFKRRYVDNIDIDKLRMAKEALEKQTAKKPKDNHHCPNCEWSQPIPLLDDEWCSECFYPEYCKHCGQRLDWSEEKANYEKRRI